VALSLKRKLNHDRFDFNRCFAFLAKISAQSAKKTSEGFLLRNQNGKIGKNFVTPSF
jgi:hypothetical protein